MRIAPHRFTTAMLGLIAGLLTATSPLAAQVPDELAGNWQMDDMSPSLLGYYSLKTGRVWITTYRWVNRKEERVEHRGTVKRNKAGDIVWAGTAKTTGRTNVTWKFEAVKQ